MQGSQFRNKLLQMLLTVELAVGGIINPALKKEGLTLRQYYILLIIETQEFNTIGSLAGVLNIAQSNISAICKTLENQGLVERKRQKDDERIVTIHLTEQGQRLLNDLNGNFEYLDKVLAEVPAKKLDLALKGYAEFTELVPLLIDAKKNKL